jgi:proteasome assembly chaperone (PAC2) family protein
VRKETKKRKKDNNGGVLFAAGMFLGIGVGLLTGEVAAFTLMGMAIGFLLMWFSPRW